MNMLRSHWIWNRFVWILFLIGTIDRSFWNEYMRQTCKGKRKGREYMRVMVKSERAKPRLTVHTVLHTGLWHCRRHHHKHWKRCKKDPNEMVKRNKRTTIKNGIKFVKPAKGHQNNNKKDMLCTQHRESVAHTRTEITFISVISFQFHILCKCVLALLLWHFAYKFIVRSGRV